MRPPRMLLLLAVSVAAAAILCEEAHASGEDGASLTQLTASLTAADAGSSSTSRLCQTWWAGTDRIGQPCARAVKEAGTAPAASPDATATEVQQQPGLSSLTKGLVGAGVSVGGLAAIAAATLLLLRRKRSSGSGHATGREALVGHDLARVHDSVVVTKHKQQVKVLRPSTGAVDLASADSAAGQNNNGAGGSPGSVRDSPDLRMVTFAASGADGSSLGEDDKQRLRAHNLQDSVVIIRAKLATAGHSLSSHKLGVGDGDGDGDGGSSAGSSSSGHGSPAASPPPAEAVTAVAPPGTAQPQDVEHGACVGGYSSSPVRSQMLLQQSPSKRVSFASARVGGGS